jgi:hypothetical protein
LKINTIIITIFAFIGFILLSIGDQSTEANGAHDLSKIASIFQDENILITEWSIHAREKMESLHNQEEIKNYTHQLKQQFSEWEWKVNAQEDRIEAIAIFKHGNESETVKILSTPTNGQFQTYVIYEMEGQGWGQQVEQKHLKTMTSRISDIFRGNATIFTCIKGEFNDKMVETLPIEMQRLLTVFQAKEIESLTENNFISTSANSTIFSESVEIGDHDMNLQLGLRNNGMGGETTLVVGTPIITIEY